MKGLLPEQLLSTRISNYLKENHPNIIFRFDIGADVPLPIMIAKRSKDLHGRWSRGYPDLFIAKPTKKYNGLYLELKAKNIYKVDGSLLKSEHLYRQNYVHGNLRGLGYKCCFCVNYKACKKIIKKYLKDCKINR